MTYTAKDAAIVKSVYFNGKDVSKRCFMASEGTYGKVGLFKTKQGRFYLTGQKNDAAKEYHRGKVVVVLYQEGNG